MNHEARLIYVLAEIERHLLEGGTWCDIPKAQTLASLVWGLRPILTVEIGVWRGGSLIPMLIAMRELGHGRAIAIDPWSAAASVAGESGENAKWWGEQVGQAGHQAAFETFCNRLDKHRIDPAQCTIVRKASDDVQIPEVFGGDSSIDLLHLDGNHTDQAVRDVSRFARKVRPGGILVLDDVAWEGGGVERAQALARDLGFCDLYPLGTGVVMQQRRP